MLADEGVSAGILLCEFIKPYDSLCEIVNQKLPEYVKNVIFIEEEILAGGFGMNLSAEMRRKGVGYRARHKIIAVDNNFAIPNVGENVWQAAGVDAQSVFEAIMSLNTK
jgi:transketolase C-terminal domain/subunit